MAYLVLYFCILVSIVEGSWFEQCISYFFSSLIAQMPSGASEGFGQSIANSSAITSLFYTLVLSEQH